MNPVIAVWARRLATALSVSIAVLAIVVVGKSPTAAPTEGPTVLVTLSMGDGRLLENADQFSALAERMDALGAPVTIVGVEPRDLVGWNGDPLPSVPSPAISAPMLWVGPPDSSDAITLLANKNIAPKAPTFLASATSDELRVRSNRKLFFGVSSNRKIATMLGKAVASYPSVVVCHDTSARSEKYAAALAFHVDLELDRNDPAWKFARESSNAPRILCRTYGADQPRACAQIFIGTASWYEALPDDPVQCPDVILSDALTRHPIVKHIHRVRPSVRVWGTKVRSPKLARKGGWGSVVHDFAEMAFKDGASLAQPTPVGWGEQEFEIRLLK